MKACTHKQEGYEGGFAFLGKFFKKGCSAYRVHGFHFSQNSMMNLFFE